MPLSCKEIEKAMEKIAPLSLAMQWDNVGLQIGHPDMNIEKLMVTLDITNEVVKEAISNHVDMIVAHHPLFVKPLYKIKYDSLEGELISKIIRNDLQVYVAHTNLDIANEGTSDYLAEKLDLKQIEVLDTIEDNLLKITAYVPKGYEDQALTEMSAAGAGWIGNYSHTSFQVLGTGTFRPLAGSVPFIGGTGDLEKVEEYRIETIVPSYLKEKVVEALINSHPYEEPAYDIYQLNNRSELTGLGRIGHLKEQMTLEQFILQVKTKLDLPFVNFIGDLNNIVRKAAVCGGSGSELVPICTTKGADVFVTGDIKYHEAVKSKDIGLSLIDAGHNATEKLLVPALARYLEGELNKDKDKVLVLTSQTKTNPWEAF